MRTSTPTATLKIAGAQFYEWPPDYPIVGDALSLAHNPDNRHDSNAIEIIAESGDHSTQIGHIPAAAAAVMVLLSRHTGMPVEVLFGADLSDGQQVNLYVRHKF
jgi:hypothetical protein